LAVQQKSAAAKSTSNSPAKSTSNSAASSANGIGYRLTDTAG
jgi:hypothetical protein